MGNICRRDHDLKVCPECEAIHRISGPRDPKYDTVIPIDKMSKEDQSACGNVALNLAFLSSLHKLALIAIERGFIKAFDYLLNEIDHARFTPCDISQMVSHGIKHNRHDDVIRLLSVNMLLQKTHMFNCVPVFIHVGLDKSVTAFESRDASKITPHERFMVTLLIACTKCAYDDEMLSVIKNAHQLCNVHYSELSKSAGKHVVTSVDMREFNNHLEFAMRDLKFIDELMKK